MTTLHLQVAPDWRTTKPRGAQWAASLLAALSSMVEGFSRHRNEWAMKDLIQAHEAVSPSFAAELRAMAARDSRD